MSRLMLSILTVTLLVACTTAEDETQTATAPQWQTLSGKAPLVIAHRGASAHLPGHTLEAYALGIDQGADFVEPDLVLTKDNVLVCRHDRYMSTTTDVADHEEFASRRVKKGDRTDWWVEDFTVAELKTLRARQDKPQRSTLSDDKFLIPTFDEVIDLVKRRNLESKRTVGIYPEPKQAEYFASIGKDIAAELLASLQAAGWDGADSPVIVQSFEPFVLKELNGKTDLPLIQLTLSRQYFDPDAVHESFIELDSMPEYADGVGPSSLLIVHEDGAPTDLIERAHALGLEVHAWTLSGDQPSPDGLSPQDETRRLYEMGVDGVFADDPGQAVRIRAEKE